MLFYCHYKCNALRKYFMDEKEKMLAGKIYDCMVPELYERRLKAGELCIKYNNLPEAHPDRAKILKEIFPNADDSLFIRGPVFVDYGTFTKFGKNCYIIGYLTFQSSAPVAHLVVLTAFLRTHRFLISHIEILQYFVPPVVLQHHGISGTIVDGTSAYSTVKLRIVFVIVRKSVPSIVIEI